jgi:5-methylcytosine-specific restriction endonuclease McrA
MIKIRNRKREKYRHYRTKKQCIDCGVLIIDRATRCNHCNGIKKRTTYGKGTFRKGKHCIDCGKLISDKAIKCRSCSKIGCIRLDMRGENNPKWNGGWNPYYGPNWDTQRKKVFIRDGGVCALCGGVGKQMDVHHQVPFSKCDNYIEANSFENLITVCPSCHRLLEKQQIDKISHFLVIKPIS